MEVADKIKVGAVFKHRYSYNYITKVTAKSIKYRKCIRTPLEDINLPGIGPVGYMLKLSEDPIGKENTMRITSLQDWMFTTTPGGPDLAMDTPVTICTLYD